MENVLNSDKDHPEILVTFIDAVMKGRLGGDRLTESDMEASISSMLDMLRYLAVRRDGCVWLCAHVFS